MTKFCSSLGNNLEERRFRLAFLYAVPIGLLGGLIGLGGAEFRLPVLAGVLKYSVSQAVPLNLAVSMVTLFVSLIIRSSILSLSPVVPFLTVVFSLIAGAVWLPFSVWLWLGGSPTSSWSGSFWYYW